MYGKVLIFPKLRSFRSSFRNLKNFRNKYSNYFDRNTIKTLHSAVKNEARIRRLKIFETALIGIFSKPSAVLEGAVSRRNQAQLPQEREQESVSYVTLL